MNTYGPFSMELQTDRNLDNDSRLGDPAEWPSRRPPTLKELFLREVRLSTPKRDPQQVEGSRPFEEDDQ